MFLAAFTSRSCTTPHAAHAQVRKLSGLGPSLTPQAEHTWLVGSNRPIRRNRRPWCPAFSSISRSSCMRVSLVFATNYRRGALDSAMP
jgi:hypothetical protein